MREAHLVASPGTRFQYFDATADDLANYLIMQNNGGRLGDRTVLSSAGVARMHTPAGNPDSPYGMGWMVTAPGVVKHNGVLSTFYADAALSPTNSAASWCCPTPTTRWSATTPSRRDSSTW